MTTIKKLVQKWDWADFVKICPENKSKPSHSLYQLVLADGKLTKKTEVQLSLF